MKLAIISGGSRGLGEALGALYRQQQWQVLEFSRSAPHPWSVRADLSQPEASRHIIESTLAPLAAQTWDDIVIIANAGVLTPIGPTSRKPADQVLANLQTNFTSPILFMTQAIAAFQAAGCRKTLLNISSGAAINPYAGWSLYCAAKAGLEAFVRTLALEQASQPRPFRVWSVSPGTIDTAMQAEIRASAPDDFPAVGRFIERRAAGELRAPARVAAGVARIAADCTAPAGERVVVDAYLPPAD